MKFSTRALLGLSLILAAFGASACPEYLQGELKGSEINKLLKRDK